MKADLEPTVRKLLAQATGEPKLELLRGLSFERKLGEGGMGTVFLLRSPTGGSLAFKLMHEDLAWDPAARDEFVREINNLSALNHNNVVGFRGAGCFDELLFLLMEYCDGGSVRERMRSAGGKLPLREAVGYTFQALEGLVYIHKAVIPNVPLKDKSAATATGLVHRDFKPGNLFLHGPAGSEVAKVADFGLAKAFELAGRSGQTRTGQKKGTAAFMPRHQIEDSKYVGPEVDVWAAAATLYNMLTGQYTRDFHGAPNLVAVVLNTNPIPIQKRDPSIPAALAKVIDDTLDDTGDELPVRSAGEFKALLEEALRQG